MGEYIPTALNVGLTRGSSSKNPVRNFEVCVVYHPGRQSPEPLCWLEHIGPWSGTGGKSPYQLLCQCCVERGRTCTAIVVALVLRIRTVKVVVAAATHKVEDLVSGPLNEELEVIRDAYLPQPPRPKSPNVC